MIAIPNYFSPEEYLQLERQSPIRHEYRYGLVYAMSGGSSNHDRIGYNLLREIDDHIGDGPCRFHGSNVQVNYADDLYYYPDAFVTCDPRDREDAYIKRHPKLIAEVLSKSTAKFDKTDKFIDYQNIESFEEYLLISQDSQQVECRRRTSEGTWETTFYQTGDRIPLTSLNLEFDISRLYRNLD